MIELTLLNAKRKRNSDFRFKSNEQQSDLLAGKATKQAYNYKPLLQLAFVIQQFFFTQCKLSELYRPKTDHFTACWLYTTTLKENKVKTYHAAKKDGVNDMYAQSYLFQGTPASVFREVCLKGVVTIVSKCQNGESYLRNTSGVD